MEIERPQKIASFLKCSTVTVRRLAEKGIIPGKRVGRQWRFDLNEVKDWFCKGETHLGRINPVTKRFDLAA